MKEGGENFMMYQKLLHSQVSHIEDTPSVHLVEEAAMPKNSKSAQ
jgi:hypothetical protein